MSLSNITWMDSFFPLPSGRPVLRGPRITMPRNVTVPRSIISCVTSGLSSSGTPDVASIFAKSDPKRFDFPVIGFSHRNNTPDLLPVVDTICPHDDHDPLL